MIKIRWMGTPEDLKWFRKHLEEDKEIRLQNVSDRLPISAHQGDRSRDRED